MKIEKYYCDVCGLERAPTALLQGSVFFGSEETGMLRSTCMPNISVSMELCSECFNNINFEIEKLVAKKEPIR